ncbi:drug:H+ antiporter-1 family protein [Xanthomonas citri pv. aurantifolii str. ICPB 10535]|nr:drug:H+ antiporter-1 family protein [Xanthomonas citri pv. aurantifolii str. ICPB 10535]
MQHERQQVSQQPRATSISHPIPRYTRRFAQLRRAMSLSPDSAPVPGRRRAALIFIFITVLIDVLSFGVIIPVLPDLVRHFTGGDYVVAAGWIGWFGFLFAAIQFVCSPLQGALSDRFGRRPVILLSCLGLGLDFILMAIAHSLPMLLLARVISGVCSASFSTANAYIADVTPPDKRAGAFGMLGAAFGIGFVAGPLIGGWLGSIGLRWPFWFAAGLALLNVLYGWFVLPELLPAQRRTARLDWSHANPLGALKLLRRYPQVFGLASVVFLANLAHYVYPSIFVLFAGYQYHWGPREVSWVLAGGRRLQHHRQCVAGRPPGAPARRTPRVAAGAGLRGDRLHHLWAGRQRHCLPDRCADQCVVGHCRTVRAGPDHPRGRRRRARSRAGRAHRSGQPGRHRRPTVVRQCLRLVHRQRCASAPAGRAVVAGRCPAGRRLGHGLETGRARRRHHTRGADVKPTYSACARVCFF